MLMNGKLRPKEKLPKSLFSLRKLLTKVDSIGYTIKWFVHVPNDDDRSAVATTSSLILW